MRSWMWIVIGLGATACGKKDLCAGDCDTGTPDDTDSPAVTEDTDEPEDTEEPEPEPVFYDAVPVTFELAQPVAWDALTFRQEIWSDTYGSYDLAVTVGADVQGTTDVSLAVTSLLEEADRGEWEQYYTGLKDGGELDATAHLDFPLIVTVNQVAVDLSGFIDEIPSRDWTFDTHIFDTLQLEDDGEETEYVAAPFEYTWNSGEIDPGPGLPYLDVTFDFDIAFETSFRATSYDIHDELDSVAIAQQRKAEDRSDVTGFVAPPGEEQAQVKFDGRAYGTLENRLTVTAVVTIEAYYSWGGNVTQTFPLTMDLADAERWQLKLDKEPVVHPRMD